MASCFASYFLLLVLVVNVFNFEISLCTVADDEALITGICTQVQDPAFCLNTFRQNLPHHPYVPIEVTSVAIHQSLQNASNNRVFIETSKEKEKDKEIQDLYAICDSGYGFLIDELQDAIQSLAKRDYNALENALFKCPRFVSDCRNVLDSKITPEMLDRSRKQFDLVLMSQIAEGLIKQ
ncbi:hypothetical protein HAX54_012204 [Datura stramonium]|uniref:Pectinesterase inhibitor domain-containing protein n=1 Tax=Datura stramonium TaxID=4076 RepID=A0ABS8Y569_DATST|nr:hypothetical protein [Datura stramonium]